MIKYNKALLIISLFTIFILVGIGKLNDGWFALMVGISLGYLIGVKND